MAFKKTEPNLPDNTPLNPIPPSSDATPAPDLSALLTQTQDASTGLQNKAATKVRRTVLAVVGLSMLVILFLIIFGTIRQKNYEEASALFDSEKYSQAAEAFAKLGHFKDSADRTVESQNWASYSRASNLIEPYRYDDTTEAKQIFLSLGDFQDSADMAVFCQNRIDYAAADDLETAGDFAAAQAGFEALGDFNNSKERARYCSDTLDYQAACALIEQGDYAAAAEKLAAPAKSNFEGADDKLELCDNKIDFAAAEQLLADGKNYEAYKAFTALGDFEGAFLRADACVLAAPKNGELYHNENYNFSQTQLTVYNSSSNDSFLKLYAVNGDLVCSFYIASEKKATVRVPEGTYTLNQAYGTCWFGLEDMFGDEGVYYRQLFGDTYEFTMESEYIYEISTRDSKDATYMNDDSTDRGSF